MKTSLLLVFACISMMLHGQSTNKIIPKNIHFTTTRIPLKSNYALVLDTIADKRVIRLKGPGVDTPLEFKTNPLKASEMNLGYLQFDTDSFFVISTGTDIDTSIQVYRKTDGKLLVRGRLFYFHPLQHVLTYSDYAAGYKFGVVNLLTGQILTFLPPEVHCVFWYRCVDKITVDDKEIKMTYYSKSNSMTTKVFARG